MEVGTTEISFPIPGARMIYPASTISRVQTVSQRLYQLAITLFAVTHSALSTQHLVPDRRSSWSSRFRRQRCEPRCRQSCKMLPSREIISLCGACQDDGKHKCTPGAPFFPLAQTQVSRRGKQPYCVVDGAPCPIAPEAILEPNVSVFTPPEGLRTRSAPASPAQLSEIFSGSRVALLLVGQAFRGASHGACVDSPLSVRSQREVAHAYVSRVCRPLEALGAQVEVLFTFPRCERRGGSGATSAPRRPSYSLLSQMRSWYGKRVAAVWEIDSMGPADGLAHGHLLLSSRSRLRNVSYDYVLQARHDVMLTQPITAWPTDFRRVLFEQRCWIVCRAAARNGIPLGCACGAGHPLFHGHRASLPDAALCPVNGCAADRLLWIPRRFQPLVSMLFQLYAEQGAGGAVSHAFIGVFFYAAAMSGLGGRDNVGFMFPPSVDEPQYVDLHVRRGELELQMSRSHQARQA